MVGQHAPREQVRERLSAEGENLGRKCVYTFGRVTEVRGVLVARGGEVIPRRAVAFPVWWAVPWVLSALARSKDFYALGRGEGAPLIHAVKMWVVERWRLNG